ncbi:MAG TPA: hypothetical protein V6C76_11450 [Drouetiella sp.]
MSCCEGEYWCPRTDELECKVHGRFTRPCCDMPEKHRYTNRKFSLTKEEKEQAIAARREAKQGSDRTCALLAQCQVNATNWEARFPWGLAWKAHGCQIRQE